MDIQSAIKLDSAAVRLHVKAGSYRVSVRQHYSAIAHYDKAAELEPVNHHHYSDRGQCYLQLGESTKALADFSKAIAVEPEFPHSYGKRGLAYRSLSQREKAVRDFDTAIALKLADGFTQIPHEWFYYRGTCFIDLGEYERALEDFDEALRIASVEAPAHYYANRAVAREKLGRIAEATEDQIHSQNAPIEALRDQISELNRLLQDSMRLGRRRQV